MMLKKTISYFKSFLILICGLFFVPSAADAGKIYFADSNNSQIRYMDTDGSNLNSISVGSPVGVEVSLSAGKMFYISNDKRVRYANLDGSGAQIIHTTTGYLQDITIDPSANKVYWTDNTSPNYTIMRANFDGTNVESFLSVSSLLGLAVDPNAQQIYYTTGSGVRRADLTGPANDTSILSLSGTRKIDLDLNNNLMFVTLNNAGEIYRANLDGTNATLINDIAPDYYVDGLAYNSGLDKLYYGIYDPGVIRASNPDGTGETTLFTSVSGNTNMRSISYLPDGNTLPGSDVTVDLTGNDDIFIKNVDTGGHTTAVPYTDYNSIYAASAVSDNVLGALIEGTWSDINTSAGITVSSDPSAGGVLIALNYTDPDFATYITSQPGFGSFTENDLRLFHLDGGNLVDVTATSDMLAAYGITGITGGVDTTNNIVYGWVDGSSFSPFGIGVNPEPTTLLLLGSALLGLLPFRRENA